MNAGFIAMWIGTVMAVLSVTGWKQLIAPSLSKTYIMVVGIMIVCLLPAPLQLSIPVDGAELSIQAAAAALLLAAIIANWPSRSVGQLFYLVSCIVLLGFLWGMIRNIYSFDPVFFWLDPYWDGPLICGLLSGILVTKAEEQLVVTIGSAAAAETLLAYLQGSLYAGMIGSGLWWDGLMIAFTAARVVSLCIKTIKLLSGRLRLLQ